MTYSFMYQKDAGKWTYAEWPDGEEPVSYDSREEAESNRPEHGKHWSLLDSQECANAWQYGSPSLRPRV